MSDTSKIIYLADDDDDDRMLFEEALKAINSDLELRLFDSGEDLCEALSKPSNSPIIIFLDINMPVMDGIECLVELRGRKHLEKVSIVVLSTSYFPNQMDKISKLGASHYFKKPSTYVELKQEIESCLERFAAEV